MTATHPQPCWRTFLDLPVHGFLAALAVIKATEDAAAWFVGQGRAE